MIAIDAGHGLKEDIIKVFYQNYFSYYDLDEIKYSTD